MDKYVKVKKIGEGSFGKAILVRSKESGEHFVVKEIGISKMKPKEKSEARKEVTVLSKMRHPNIVQYTESFEENGHLYIVMEYCEGGDLYALINKQKGVPFSEQQVLNWFVQLCLALKHVHDRKILHRDIKTSNIFLTKSGTIKLGDFGIARVLNNTMELARTCIGTPYYLSPEICENKPYNNKSDVWALGCVVYETLTLKHAFEAGNMKNLVLKIIRGSYPPVPSRYSYDLRILVSQLFRRSPRERPSINSILRLPFLANLTEQFLSPEQHEEEFSHTVLHKGRAPRPSGAKPYGGRYQVAGKRAQNLEVRGGAVGARHRRDQQIVSVYGPSVAAKKPKPSAAARPPKPDDYLEKRRQSLLEQEKRRKNALAEEKKKRLEDLQKRQRERAIKSKEDQLRRAREDARAFNLKRSAELNIKNSGEPAANKISNAPRDRPISAPKERGDYDKYHQYLDKLEKGDRLGAAQFVAPELDRVKKAWEERQKGQEAVLAAQINKIAAEQAAGRAQVVSEFLQRKREAIMNKQKDVRAKENKVGVAAALKPYSAPGAKDAEEREYLAKLKQIRQQNYNERKVLNQKFVDHKKAYKVEIPASDDVDEDEKKKKIQALQQQAADRAKILQENIENRRKVMDARQEMRKHEAKARARGIIPPDERPVKYNPNPIGITQALHAVGAPVAQKEEDNTVDEILSPSRADPQLRKKILKRVNQRFSVDFEEEPTPESGGDEKEVEKSPAKNEPSPRPLPELPEKPKEEPRKESAWKARKNEDIVNEISGLPLQNTTTLLEGTTVPAPTQPPVPKRQWQAPSGTFVRQLNQMTLQAPTLTMPVEPDKDEKSSAEKPTQPEKTDEATAVTSVAAARQLFEKKSAEQKAPSIDNKTIVLRKSPVSISAAPPSGKKDVEKKLAPNFKPLKPSGTYVIKSLNHDQPLDVNGKPTTKDGENPSSPQKLPVDSVSAQKSDKCEIKTGSPEKASDPSEDIEEVKLENESKTQTKPEKPHRAWSEESQNQSVSSQSVLLPKPTLLPKPSLSQEPSNSMNIDTKKEISSSKTEKEATSLSSPLAVPASSDLPRSESPLFRRVNGNRPESLSTTPNPKIEKLHQSDSADRLSKTLYCTASDKMLMKLTLGHFDSPNPKLLRTCSLPDLNNVGSDDTDAKDDADNDAKEEEVSVMSSMNDTNFDDVESLSDDDDLDDMRANLQSVLLNSSKPDSTDPSLASNFSTSLRIHGGSETSSDEEEDLKLHEDWQSDSESCSSGEEDLSDTESVFSRLEHNREELERELGFEKFLQVYRYVQASHEDEDEGVMECQSRVRAVLGKKHDALYPKVLQLVMADGAYCEDNT